MCIVIQEEWSSVSNDSDHVRPRTDGSSSLYELHVRRVSIRRSCCSSQRANFDANQGKFLQMTVVSTNFILNGSSKKRIRNRLWKHTYWYPISLCCSTHLTANAWARSDYFLNVLLVYQSGVKHRSRFPQNLWPHWFLCRDTWSKSVGLLKWLTLDKWLFLHPSPPTPPLELTVNCYRTPHTPRCVKFQDDIFVRKRRGEIRKKVLLAFIIVKVQSQALQLRLWPDICPPFIFHPASPSSLFKGKPAVPPGPIDAIRSINVIRHTPASSPFLLQAAWNWTICKACCL